MIVRKQLASLVLLAILPPAFVSRPLAAQSPAQNSVQPAVFGYADFTAQSKIEEKFLAVPDARLAGQHLKILTSEPHLASTPEDRKTAEYVAQKFREAGLETEIVPYRVLMNQPKTVSVEAYDSSGKLLMSGPTREHVEGDPYQDNPRVVMPFSGSSGSGDVTADVVYANYGRLEDFDYLAAQHIDLRGKIVLARYGANFRGVKVYLAEQRGAVGVLIYSDPHDDGYYKGDAYPIGPWRPETGIQYGSVQYIFKYSGDPETPGVASTLDLPDSARVSPYGNEPHIISIPLSYHDAAPILQALKGPSVPQEWQGALPFRYHLGQVGGQGGVKVHLVSVQDFQRRIIWDVIGKIKGTEYPDEWVIVGNHRDAWIYGAVDPSSGTAAMLEAVHGLGALTQQGWRPKRTIVFASWDAEEEGLIGSTEWVEQNAQALEHAVAYFNTDVAVAGADFSASAVPSLKQFLREVTRSVPSPLGGTVYQQWRINSAGATNALQPACRRRNPRGRPRLRLRLHALLPAHWRALHRHRLRTGPMASITRSSITTPGTRMNADPNFVYLQEMARVFGLEALRMADADVLPYDYVAYAAAISSYIDAAKNKATGDSEQEKNASDSSARTTKKWWRPSEPKSVTLDFSAVQAAAARFSAAAERAHSLQISATGDLAKLNLALRQAEAGLISEQGLPNRPWYKHTIYAPGEFTGYSAVVIPGVNEALDARDLKLATQQLTVLTQALTRAAQALEGAQ